MLTHLRTSQHRGQSLPIVVLMLATLFMIIGLGIDGGLLYAQRRLMQNTADAACLAAATRLAMGETNLQAEAAAQQVVANNLGPTPGTGANAPGTLNYGTITELYTPVTGSGVNLTRGIVLNGPEIRVALESSAFTYFLRVLGQEEYTVTARARCDATAGGGGSPFAVARWRAYQTNNGELRGGISTDLPLQGQNIVSNNQTYFVRDILGRYSATLPDPSRITEWPGWGSPDYPGSPTLGTGLFSQAITPATPQHPGIEVAIAGSNAGANQGSSAFAGQVLLDWRNITTGGEFYGGISPATNPQTYKDIVTRQIVEGYNGPWIPPGTQLGFTNGVSAGQVERPFQLRNPTLPITMPVLIYNGTVYENVNLQLLQTSAQPQTKGAFTAATQQGQDQFPANCVLGSAQGAYMYDFTNGQPLSTTETLNQTLMAPISHTVTLRPYMGNNINNSPAVQSGARIRSFASVNGTLWNDLQVQIQTTLAGSTWLDMNNQGVAPAFPPVGQPGININHSLARPFNLRVQQSRRGSCFIFGNATANPPTTDQHFILPLKPVQGALSIYLEAEDTTTGLRRGRYVLLRIGGADGNNFYAYFPGTLDYEPLDRPTTGANTVTVPFDVEYTNGNSVPFSQLTFSNYTWFEDGNQVGTPADIGVTVVSGQGNRPNLRITVGPNAPINRNFHVRVQVSRNGVTQWLWYYVRVRLPVGNSSNVTQYVYTLGYANFRITRITANNVYGVAVSGLLKPGDVIMGMQPRLLPWQD